MIGPWTPSDAAAINEFLNTPLGNKWLIHLMSRKPRIDINSTEKAAMTGVLGAGYELVFQQIDSMRKAEINENPAAKPVDMTRD